LEKLFNGHCEALLNNSFCLSSEQPEKPFGTEARLAVVWHFYGLGLPETEVFLLGCF